jgi:4'-phosphopantetheinyl transferase
MTTCLVPHLGSIELVHVSVETPEGATHLEWLSDEEATIAARRRDGALWAAHRVAVRGLLGDRLGMAPAEIDFVVGAHGKPEVRGADLWCNWSHSQDLLLLGICRDAPIGVDIEHLVGHPDLHDVALRYFGDRSAEAIRADLNPVEAFYERWTRLESVVKAHGVGLSAIDSVDFEDTELPGVVRIDGIEGAAAHVAIGRP